MLDKSDPWYSYNKNHDPTGRLASAREVNYNAMMNSAPFYMKPVIWVQSKMAAIGHHMENFRISGGTLFTIDTYGAPSILHYDYFDATTIGFIPHGFYEVYPGVTSRALGAAATVEAEGY